MTSMEGGCLCGAIRYRVSGKVLYSVICHCRSCQRASGAPSVAWLTLERKDFNLLQGSPATVQSSPGVSRGFCGHCGTPLSYERRDRTDTLDVATATLDDPAACPPDSEIWLHDRLPWESIDGERRGYSGALE